MSSEYWTTIGAIAQVFDGPHATPKKIDTGPYFLSISSLDGGRLDLSKSAHVGPEDFAKWTKRVTPEAGDVLFSYETRLGEAALMPENVVACLGRRMGLLRPDRSKVLPDYLLYAYLSPAFQQTIKEKTIHGATVERIALKELPSFSIWIPPLDEQKKIVSILRSIDAKSGLNTQTNQTLEQVAQALFKSWFVDFDPVIDNALAAGNAIPEALAERAAMRQALFANEVDSTTNNAPARLPEATRALFPDSFEEHLEFGWIPVGWDAAPLGNYVTVKRGGSPRPIKDFVVPAGYPWTKIADATANDNPFIFKTKEFIKEEGLKKTVYLKSGTLILSNSATPGLPRFLALDACIHDGWLHFPEKSHFTDSYLYHLFLMIREHLVSQGNGSVFTNLKTDILREQLVLVPSLEVIEKFDDTAAEVLSTVKANSKQSEALANLRDTLLSKLLSGELALPEANDAEEIED